MHTLKEEIYRNPKMFTHNFHREFKIKSTFFDCKGKKKDGNSPPPNNHVFEQKMVSFFFLFDTKIWEFSISLTMLRIPEFPIFKYEYPKIFS